MQISLKQDYRGDPSKGRIIPAGVYDTQAPELLGIVDYLLSSGHASQTQPHAIPAAVIATGEIMEIPANYAAFSQPLLRGLITAANAWGWVTPTGENGLATTEDLVRGIESAIGTVFYVQGNPPPVIAPPAPPVAPLSFEDDEAVVQDEEPADERAYDTMTVAELTELAESLELVVVGTGSKGAVLKSDLISALSAAHG